MRILSLGCGYVGSILALHLSKNMPSAEIVISDADQHALEKVIRSSTHNNVTATSLHFEDYQGLVKKAKDFDVLIGLTPGRFGFDSVKAAIESGTDIVDLSFMQEDPFTLHEEALKAGVTVIPDCGVAPGLSNILVGRALSLIDDVSEVVILVGGLPQQPMPPLNYNITWSLEDLIEEYVRKARVVSDGEVIEVDALDGLEEVEFPGLGRLEAFYTDGVRTLHHTVKNVTDMWEKTMRYPGHAEKIRLLRELGFFEERLGEMSPRDTTLKVLERNLSLPEVKDLVALQVAVRGVKEGREMRYTYRLLDYYDEEGGVTAMGRTTAYTASAVIQLLARRGIGEKGIVPPERLGMHETIFSRILADLRRDGIRIAEFVERG